MIRFYKRNNKALNNGSDGSSLAIALFFFMLCALMCAGILYLANSSSYGVLKHFNANNITPFVSPEPIPTEDPNLTSSPTPTPDEAHPEEQAAIDLVYNTLEAEFHSAFIEVNNGGEYSINASSNPRSMAYEMISYINSYINRGNFKEKDGKYSFATGAKGYKWMESSMVKELSKEDYICKDYYRRLVDEAVASINEFGDFGSFVD